MSELTLADALEVLIDHRGKTPKKMGGDFTAQGVKVISALLVKNGKLDLSEARHVDDDMHDKWMRVKTKRHDVVLTSEAPLGRCALIPDDDRYVLGQRVFGLRGRPGVLDSRYLFYALQTPTVQAQLTGRATGTTVLGIRQSELVKIRIPARDYREQQAIAATLGALDDKIAVNDRIATTADSLRSALLEYARQRRPHDFTTTPLSQVADFINGRAFTKDATGTGRMVIRIAEINSGPGSSTVYNDIAVDDKYLARPGDVLFSWSGSLAVARWFRSEAIINQHIFKVIPRDNNPHWLAFEAVRSRLAHYRAIAADKATTMGHIQRHHLDEDVEVPNSEAITHLDPSAKNLWLRALEAEQESLRLAALRDALLPELMSGRLRVRDAEKVVEEAV